MASPRFAGAVRWFGAALLMVGLTTSAVQAAPANRPVPSAKEQARALVIQGVGELQRGDYVKALSLFQRAYARYPSPKILFNMAQTYRELGRPVAALNAYERFLRNTPPNTAKRLVKLARARVQNLKGQVGTLLVDVNLDGAAILIDGKEIGLSPMDVPLRVQPGKHVVVVQRKGYITRTMSLQVDAGKRVIQKITLRKPVKRVVVKRIVYEERRKPRKGWAVFWTGVGVTAALMATLAVTGALTLKEQSILDDATRSVADRQQAARRGKRYQWVNDGLLIGAGVSAIFTTVWGLVVVMRSGGIERVPIRLSEPTLRVTPGPTGVTLQGRF